MKNRVYASAYSHWLLLAALCFLILVARRPDSLTNPQFYAEDGHIFYTQQLIGGWATVFVPYGGYLHLVPRLSAGIESAFPAKDAPLFCNLLGLMLQAGSYALLVLPTFRYLIDSTVLRAAAALVLAADLDGNEMIGNELNIQWHLTLVVLVLLFIPNAEPGPRRRELLKTTLLALTTALIALTAPGLLIALPLALWRAVAYNGRGRVVALVFCAVSAIQLGVVLAATPFYQQQIFRSEIHGYQQIAAQYGAAAAFGTIATSSWVAWLYRVLFSCLLGRPLSVSMSHYAGPNVAVAGLFLVAIVSVWLYLRFSRSQRKVLAVCLYLTVASVVSSLISRGLLDQYHTGSGNVSFGATRYFVVGCYALVLVAALAIESAPFRLSGRAKALSLVCIFSYGTFWNFAVPPLPDFHWTRESGSIDRWQRDRSIGTADPGVRVAIPPSPWSVALPELSPQAGSGAR